MPAAPFAAPAATAPAPASGPVPGATTGQDWVGLEAILPDGDHVVVRSVSSTGEASVQMGREVEKGGYVFSDGSVCTVPVADLVMASCSKGDKIIVLTGDKKGLSGILKLINKGESFMDVGDGRVDCIPTASTGKLAVDHHDQMTQVH